MQVQSLAIFAVLVVGGFTVPTWDTDLFPWVTSGQFEGDILLDSSQSNRVGMANSTLLWPKATLYYRISRKFSPRDKKKILDAIEEYHRLTCVKLVERTDQKDYVSIKNSASGCFSHVGRIGGAQPLNLGRACMRQGTIIHELLHALGTWHEQSAPDRDEYVTILWENIIPKYKHNFAKYNKSVATNFKVGYDYGSVMHYPSNAFSKNYKQTIIPKKDAKAVIGQRKDFSAKDIQKLHRLYKCK